MKVTFQISINFPDDLTPEQAHLFGAWIQHGAKSANYGITRKMIEQAYDKATGSPLPKGKMKPKSNIISIQDLKQRTN